MATGRSNHLTKQIGEYLVAAELGRLDLVAATFSGNVPDYDIVATDSACSSVLVQVKAVTGTSWQFDIRRFVDVQLDGQKQVVGAPTPISAEIVCVMVALSGYGSDRFYVLPLKTLQGLLIDLHRRYLAKHGGVRPKKHDSFHCAITEQELAPFKDGWLREFRDNRRLLVCGVGA
jgi:hypothetical protein